MMRRHWPRAMGKPRSRLDVRPGGIGNTTRPGVPGRLFVVGSVGGALLIWGTLYVIFIDWRQEIRGRIDYGKSKVAPVVGSLSAITPPGIPEQEWEDAVRRSEAMLDEVVGTGRLDPQRMESLRSDLTSRVAEARRSPRVAPTILGRIWDDMARLKRLRDETERPTVLPAPDRSARLGGEDP
ncbi:hypothetical protein [Tautonia plasticadhaerens]|uniref:Uncharacterized protein n=1 Tax=Tautonia plasticadhaerens TaxID=2527974 RepID=A0A518H935_9BACT|nr:hypothetical protein [Tautonia plasticadhaerens]QDV37354.1 hypothetical protein ElP_52920 [Tautonia plasticadhaerens]